MSELIELETQASWLGWQYRSLRRKGDMVRAQHVWSQLDLLLNQIEAIHNRMLEGV